MKIPRLKCPAHGWWNLPKTPGIHRTAKVRRIKKYNRSRLVQATHDWICMQANMSPTGRYELNPHITVIR